MTTFFWSVFCDNYLEIIKKRISKAFIKDSTERINQPGKVCVIYTEDILREEYAEYFKCYHIDCQRLEIFNSPRGMKIRKMIWEVQLWMGTFFKSF